MSFLALLYEMENTLGLVKSQHIRFDVGMMHASIGFAYHGEDRYTVLDISSN
jgi:hypothetical protein